MLDDAEKFFLSEDWQSKITDTVLNYKDNYVYVCLNKEYLKKVDPNLKRCKFTLYIASSKDEKKEDWTQLVSITGGSCIQSKIKGNLLFTSNPFILPCLGDYDDYYLVCEILDNMDKIKGKAYFKNNEKFNLIFKKIKVKSDYIYTIRVFKCFAEESKELHFLIKNGLDALLELRTQVIKDGKYQFLNIKLTSNEMKFDEEIEVNKNNTYKFYMLFNDKKMLNTIEIKFSE